MTKNHLLHALSFAVMTLFSSVIAISVVIFFEAERSYTSSHALPGPKSMRAEAQVIPFSCADPKYTASPICAKEHPRLHITKATLPYFQNKVATSYKSEYQALVSLINGQFGSLSVANADLHALIYALGPIAGINYGVKVPDDYGKQAVKIMLDYVTKLTPAYTSGGSYRGDYYAIISRAYDWTWPLMTPAERAAIANLLADKGNIYLTSSYGTAVDPKTGEVTQLWSSGYYANEFPWYFGLAIFGDGIRDADAQILLDQFDKRMLNGRWLDARNWAARYNGGETEFGQYSYWHPVHHSIQIDGWASATGINYATQGTTIADAYFNEYFGQFQLYRMGPYAKQNTKFPAGREWRPVKFMESWPWTNWYDSTSGSRLNEVVMTFGESLKAINSPMAALNRWFLENRLGDKLPYAELNLLPILLSDRSIPAQSPSQLGLPGSKWFEGVGMAAMRTGLESLNDTAAIFLAPHYQLDGHDWTSWVQIPNGILIEKYGPLLVRHHSYIRSYHSGMNRMNNMRFTDPLVQADGGFKGGLNSAPKVQDYKPNSNYDIGGMMRLEMKDQGSGNYDYLFADYTKYYLSSRVKKYTRQFVYLKPKSNTDADYIVVFDRAESARPDIIKRFELSTAFNPAINGTETKLRDGKWEYAGSNEIVIKNNMNPDPYSKVNYEGHGQLFVKSLLPLQRKMVKVGGPGPSGYGANTGFEFELDDGTFDTQHDEYNNMRDARGGAYHTGTFYTDVVPLVPQAKDNFLHVLQTADTLNPTQSSAMVQTSLVESQEGNMQGAFIAGSTGQDNAIVMFGKDERVLSTTETITYTVNGTGNARHVIADLPAGRTYDIYDNGVKVGSANTSDLRTTHAKARNDIAAGTLSFTSSLGSSHTYQITPAGIAPPPPNQSPTITNITATPQTGTAPLTVSFTSNATDPDGAISSYSWNFGDGTSLGTTQNLTHTYAAAGTFSATLTVSDNGGAKATKSITITVSTSPPTSSAPTILIDPVSSAALEGATATFTVSVTGTTPLSYEWQKNGTPISGANLSSYTTPPATKSDNGAKYRVIVANSVGSATSKEATLTVSLSPFPEIALTKSASASSPNQGDTVKYTLTYKNNGSADASNITITDTVPPGLSYITGSASGSPVFDSKSNSLTWTIPSVPVGGSGSVTFDVKVE